MVLWFYCFINKCDLRKELHCTKEVMQAMLCYINIIHNTFTANGDSELAFNVRALPDLYQLPHLYHLAEMELLALLREETVLNFLGRAFGTGGPNVKKKYMLYEY